MQTAASMYPISTRPSVALLRPSLVYNPGSSCSFPGPIHRGAFVPPVAFGQSTHGSRRRLFPLCQARAGISAASTASSSGGHGGNGDGGSSGHGDGKFGWGRNNMSTAKGPVPSEMVSLIMLPPLVLVPPPARVPLQVPPLNFCVVIILMPIGYAMQPLYTATQYWPAL